MQLPGPILRGERKPGDKIRCLTRTFTILVVLKNIFALIAVFGYV